YNADKNIKGFIHTELLCHYFSNLCNTLLVEKLCDYVVYIFRYFETRWSVTRSRLTTKETKAINSGIL
ncbi:hypothetical protein OZ662_09015, partial [Elizabethkingia sp. HX WYD]